MKFLKYHKLQLNKKHIIKALHMDQSINVFNIYSSLAARLVVEWKLWSFSSLFK